MDAPSVPIQIFFYDRRIDLGDGTYRIVDPKDKKAILCPISKTENSAKRLLCPDAAKSICFEGLNVSREEMFME